MPTPQEENWRYVEVPQGLPEAMIPDSAGASPSQGDIEPLLGDLAGRADIVDGHVATVSGEHVSKLADITERPVAGTAPPADRFARRANRRLDGSPCECRE